MISLGANLHEQNKDGFTAFDIIFDLLKVKDNINRKELLRGKYPLQFALEFERHPAFQLAWQASGRKGNLTSFLLSQGAKTSVQDELGNTPLHIAIERGDVKLAKLLLNYDFSIIENNKGKLPINIARKKTLTEIVKIIEVKSQYFKEETLDLNTVPTKSDTISQRSKKNFTSK